MPFAVTLHYIISPGTTNKWPEESGYAWPRHPEDPTNPTRWGPPDAPLGHLPYGHAAIQTVTHGDDTLLKQIFAYREEWDIAQLPDSARLLTNYPDDVRDLEIIWNAIPADFQRILQKFRNPRDLQILKNRLALVKELTPSFQNPSVWVNPEIHQKVQPPGTRVYELRCTTGNNMAANIYHTTILNLHTQLQAERQKTCRFPSTATARY